MKILNAIRNKFKSLIQNRIGTISNKIRNLHNSVSIVEKTLPQEDFYETHSHYPPSVYPFKNLEVINKDSKEIKTTLIFEKDTNNLLDIKVEPKSKDTVKALIGGVDHKTFKKIKRLKQERSFWEKLLEYVKPSSL